MSDSDRVGALQKAYHTLGVTSQSTDKDVRRAFQRLISVHHPDRASPGLTEKEREAHTAQAAAINVAYELIINSRRDNTQAPPPKNNEKQIQANIETLQTFLGLKESALEIMPEILSAIDNIKLIEEAKHEAALCMKNFPDSEQNVTSTARMIKATLKAFGAQTELIMIKKESDITAAEEKLEAVEKDIAEFNDFWTQNGIDLNRFSDLVSMLPEFSDGKLTPEKALQKLVDEPHLERLREEINDSCGSWVSRFCGKIFNTQTYKQTKAQLDAIDKLAILGPELAEKINNKFGISIDDQQDKKDNLTLKDVFKGPNVHPYLWELDRVKRDLDKAKLCRNMLSHDDIKSMGPSLAQSLCGIGSIHMEGVNEYLSKEQKNVLDYLNSYYSNGYSFDKTIKISTIEAATGEQELTVFESSVLFNSQQRIARSLAIQDVKKYSELKNELDLMKRDLGVLTKEDFSKINPADDLAMEVVCRRLQKPEYYEELILRAKKLKGDGKLVNNEQRNKIVYRLTGEQIVQKNGEKPEVC